jgi:RNA polymerase sigma factor (sigma-70 family)
MPPEEAAQLESEYLANREDVIAMLRSGFPRLDHDELYHDAWAELLELRQRGDAPRSVRGLLKTIAWRRARDHARKRRPVAIDPTGPALALARDPGPQPDEQAQVRIDAAALRQIIEQLEPRQATVLKLKFDWGFEAREIRAHLGISNKRLEKIVTEAYKVIAAELEQTDGVTAWSRKQRSLLLACEIGLATTGQRARAQRMLDDDPACRVMLHEMRCALRDVAAALPLPVLFAERAPDPAPILDRVTDACAAGKQALASLVGRGGQSGLVEQTSGAGAVGLGGGAAVKAVAACLAVVGGGSLCVNQALFVDRDPAPATASKSESRVQRKAPKPERAARLLPAASAARSPVTRRAQQPRKRPAQRQRVPPKEIAAPAVPVSSPVAQVAASPAPAQATEFGPGATGSSSPPAAPAVAAKDGGGEFAP